MLIVVINGVRKYFDRQQSRWIFPRSSVFHRGAQVWRDYLYTCTEIADSVSASRSGINKAAVSFVPHTLRSQWGHNKPSLARPRSPGCKVEQGKRLFGCSQSGSLQLDRWQLSCPWGYCSAQLPACCQDADAGLSPPACFMRKGTKFWHPSALIFWGKAHAFLGDVLVLVRKL